MLIEGQVKFYSPQNSAGVSQEKGAELIFQTIEAIGDQFLNQKKHILKNKTKKPNIKNAFILLIHVIQVSWSLDMASCLEKCHWPHVFSLEVHHGL